MVANAEVVLKKDVSYGYNGNVYTVKDVEVRVCCEAELAYYTRATRNDPCDWEVDESSISFYDEEVQNTGSIIDENGNEVSDELYDDIVGENDFNDNMIADFDFDEMVADVGLDWYL